MQVTQIMYVKCWNYQAAQKCDHWQIKSELSAKKLAWFSDGSKLSAHSLPQMTSGHLKIRLRRSESEYSPHPPGKCKLVNMRWLSWLSPGHARGRGGGGLQMTGTLCKQDHICTHHIHNLSSDPNTPILSLSNSLSTFKRKTAHLPWRTSWSSLKMCLPCLIIIHILTLE